MGVLQRFERRLESLVGTAFARIFKGQVEPIEVAKALQREAEERRAVVGAGRVLVPNRFVVELGPSDYGRLAPWEAQLTNTFAEMVQDYADDEGWGSFGDVDVRLVRADDLVTGVFRVASSVDPEVPPRRRPPNSLSAATGGPPPGEYPPPQGEYAPSEYGQAGYGAPPQQPTGVRHSIGVDGSDINYELQHGSNILGRGQDADLRLPDTGVSRRHVDVRFDGNGALVVDMGSTNGTTVNGQRVSTWQLQHGDVIRIGHSSLVYRQDYA